jgi:hypothetical protein
MNGEAKTDLIEQRKMKSKHLRGRFQGVMSHELKISVLRGSKNHKKVEVKVCL